MTLVNQSKPQYPDDWPLIARRVKEAKNWTCEKCGRKPPSYPVMHISVHHLDHNTFNNDPSNLIVLCAEHHFVYEREHRLHLRRERLLNHIQASGQLVLDGVNPYPMIE